METQTITGTGTTKRENDFKPIPSGDYLLRMNKIKEAKTRAGDPCLQVSYEVVRKVGDEDNKSGTKNRLIFETFVLKHSNPKVVEVAKDRIGKLLKAVGVDDGLEGIGGDVSKLNNYTDLPFIGDVMIDDNEKLLKPTNKVRKFKRR